MVTYKVGLFDIAPTIIQYTVGRMVIKFKLASSNIASEVCLMWEAMLYVTLIA